VIGSALSDDSRVERRGRRIGEGLGGAHPEDPHEGAAPQRLVVDDDRGRSVTVDLSCRLGQVFPVEDQQTTPPRQFPFDLGGLERGNLERPGAVVYELLVVMNQTWYAAARRVDAANLDSALGNLL